MFIASAVLAALTTVGLLWPRVVTVPIAVMAGWIALSLVAKATRLWWTGGKSERKVPMTAEDDGDEDEGA